MASVLIICFSDLARDPRVNRQIRLLCQHHQVTAAGYGDPRVPGVEFIQLDPGAKTPRGRALSAARLLARRYESYYDGIPSVRQALARFHDRHFDLILANDSDTWPLATILRTRNGGKVIMDAHEYTPREFEDVWWWRLFYQRYKTALCRRHLPSANRVLTVCAGIADQYSHAFHVRPVVIRNVPMAAHLSPAASTPGKVRLIHHGGAVPARKIENMIEMIGLLDSRFSLDLMLIPADPTYTAKLRDMAASHERIRFLEPVPMPEIANTINSYDFGLYILEPTSFNNLHALPNKFFEFIQARLAVAIGPSPEMARIVKEEDCGIVADSFDPAALAQALRDVTPAQIARWKANSATAATRLCWESEGRILLQECDHLLAPGPCVE